MSKIAFRTSLGLSGKNLQRLAQVNKIIDEYRSQGYRLTLRQLYYQLVSRDIIPNNVREYAKVGEMLTKGRMGGAVDWSAIEDRVRVPHIPYSVDDIEDAIQDTINYYRLDRQKEQKNYIELWVEKDALSSVLKRKTEEYHVRLMVNRGYSSCTAMFDAYNRVASSIVCGQKAHILYLGDHDPSGLDMIRDIRERLLEFMFGSSKIRQYYDDCIFDLDDDMMDKIQKEIDDYIHCMKEDFYGLFDDGNSMNEPDGYKFYCFHMLQVKHIGLTSEQVKKYNPPPNPAKLKDPRSKWYLKNFGNTSWEVDALNPQTLHQLIDTEIKGLMDMTLFNKQLGKEKTDKNELKTYPGLQDKIVDLKKDLLSELEGSDFYRIAKNTFHKYHF